MGDKSYFVMNGIGVKVNSQVYLSISQEKPLPWLKETFQNNYIILQDWCSAHTANVTQKLWKDHFRGFWEKSWCQSHGLCYQVYFGNTSEKLCRIIFIWHSGIFLLKLFDGLFFLDHPVYVLLLVILANNCLTVQRCKNSVSCKHWQILRQL